jgi:hypothetical protein
MVLAITFSSINLTSAMTNEESDITVERVQYLENPNPNRDQYNFEHWKLFNKDKKFLGEAKIYHKVVSRLDKDLKKENIIKKIIENGLTESMLYIDGDDEGELEICLIEKGMMTRSRYGNCVIM